MPVVTLSTIEAARAFSERNRIAGERDWNRQPWLNKHSVYERFKRDLAEEVSPSSPRWRPAVKALAEALHV